MDQWRDLMGVRPWARTSLVGGIGIGLAAFIQSAVLGRAELATIVVGSACVVVSVVLYAVLAWRRWVEHSTPAASTAIKMTAVVNGKDGTTVAGYAFPVTKRHLMTSRSVVQAATGSKTVTDGQFLDVTWTIPDKAVRTVSVTALANGYVLLTLMPEDKLPRRVKAASLVRSHTENALLVAEGWHQNGNRKIGGRAHHVDDRNRVVAIEDGAATGDELAGAPLVQERNRKVVGLLDGKDRLGPRYLPLTRDRARALMGGASWWTSTGWLVPAVITAVVALVAVVLPVLGDVRPGHGVLAGCEGKAKELSVVVSTEKDGLIEELADEFEDDYRGEDGACFDLEVFGVNSGDAAEAIADGWATAPEGRLECPVADPEACEVDQARKPDLWLPTESVWPELLAAGELGRGGADELAEHDGEWPSVASSVLTILMPESKREKLSGTPDWNEVVTKAANGELTLAIDDPIGSTSGMATSVALNEALVAGHGDEEAVGLLRDAIASVPDELAGQDITRLMDRVHQDPDLLAQMDAVIAQEQTAYLYNCGDPLGADDFSCREPVTDAEHRMVAVVPDDTIYAFDHPAVAMALLDSDETKRAAADAFVDFLRERKQQQRFRDWGLRAAGDPERATDQLEDVVGAEDVETITAWPKPKTVNQWRQQWQNVRLPVRVLLSIDTSGSMEQINGQDRRVRLDGFEDACTGRTTDNPTYLQVAQNAALNAIGELKNGRDAVGLDWFPPAGKDTATVIEPLNDATRSRLESEICAMTAFGETPLYDAIRDANASIDAADTEVSDRTVIVLLSDGGQNPPQSLDALLDQVGGEGAVPVIAVGIGDQAPIDVLGRLTRETGGALRNLSRPADVANLDHVLVDVFKGLAGKVS
ncbi:Mg-chelatase subunit ChlD [Nocardioides luteus]|uniref:VWFA domain-containing protein n=1 Tax=Nocardioides luteus TaxID=1844 RepID=A0ABQ5STH2_9ACTN|nr:VWA domain-containing protein [Nocardioides luteus]MDR7309868.1 Mg-chelatase subunit ChlD [Nocardioides luteus]GGR59939.1 hypothetical protein GCM10010197_28580 [Nocardioides luteus]GLJ67224.1 hypothetical protein GCM10017579_12600 [Nocardioides luteus]